jgi:endonuclease YncB( thermonuclease family)
MLLVVLVAFAIFAFPARAEEIAGAARVIDGDTIEIGGERIRLFGIDAPEGAQSCLKANRKSYPCGEVATKRVESLTMDRDVRCEGNERDHRGRLLAVCRVGEIEINSTLVREGLAWAFVKYSRAYVPEEAEARAAKRGVFAADNTTPWDLRAQKWGEAERAFLEQNGCVIKGNVNRTERIYHMPWQRDYAKIVMELKGKRWFCSDDEAEREGWRPAKR